MASLKQCPKCEQMVDSRGYSMHVAYCKGEKENVSRETTEVDKQESIKKCHVCDSKNIVRLDEFKIDGKQFDKKKLYSMGITHVCVSCGELLK